MRNQICVAGIGSVTYAMKAQELLAASGIRSKVIRLRPEQTKRGCAYGISLGCGEFRRALSLLRNAGIQANELQG